jgi:hypothetical protein
VKEDKEDFGGLMSVNNMEVMEYSWVTPMAIRRLLRLIKIKKLFGYGLE